MSDNVALTPSHLLAAIGFEAKRISAAVDQHAMGAQFPAPQEIAQAIGRMSHLNQTLVQLAEKAVAEQATMNGASSMSAELN